MKHTKGKWEVCRGLVSTGATPIRVKGENLAWVCGKDSALAFSPEETLANARLIAAAPELLAALEHTLAALEDAQKLHPAWIYTDARNAAKEAISKAK